MEAHLHCTLTGRKGSMTSHMPGTQALLSQNPWVQAPYHDTLVTVHVTTLPREEACVD